MNLKNKLLFDTRNYFLSKIVPGFMGLFTVMVFVRMVGYEQYGRYAVLFAIVTACATGGAGWLSHGILRFHSQHVGTDEEHSFRSGSHLGMFLSASVGAIAVCAITWRGRSQAAPLLLATLVLFIPMLVYAVELTRLQASLRSGMVVWVESIRAVASFTIPIALVFLAGRKSYLLLLAGVGIGYLVPLLVRFATRKQDGSVAPAKSLFGEEERQALKKIWTYGWPVALWLACQQCLVVSDRYFIQRFWGYSAAGVYASIYDVIVRSLSLVFAPITLSVHSVLIHRWNQGDRRGTLTALRKAMGYELLLFIPVPVVLFLLNSWIARLILGKVNLEAGRALIPLAIAGFLWQIALLAHKPLEILCLTKRMLLGNVASLAINVAGNLLLVPRFGFIAAAYLSVASSFVYILLLYPLTPMRLFHKAMATDPRVSLLSIPSEEVEAQAT